MIVLTQLPFLEGCPTRPAPSSPPSAQRRLPGQLPKPAPLHEGQPYDVVADASLLTVLAFRGGALAKAGHNHVIASHSLHGTLYVPDDLARTTFEVVLPVTELTVDEAALRAEENEAEFPPDVSDSAKDGTRKNMLGGSLLDAAHYPEIVLRSLKLEPANGSHGADWLAQVQVAVRDHGSTVVVPAHYQRHADEIVISGEFPLRQTDLGLTPYSALLGALQVVDELKVRFRIVARAAATRST
jgi:polyisoprenoid-binding protein YceI